MRNNEHSLILIVIIFMLLCFESITASSVLAPSLQEKIKTASKGQMLPVIVTFSPQTDIKKNNNHSIKAFREIAVTSLKQNARLSQKAVKDFLRSKNMKEPVSLWSINSLSLKAPVSVISELELLDGVVDIRYDDIVELSVFNQNVSTLSVAQSNIQLINVSPLWDMGFTGSGVVVAVLDSGVDFLHPDLSAKWRGGNNSWYDPYNFTLEPYDVDGHGTNVTGVIVGGDNSGITIGAAFDAQWIAAKIFDDSNEASYSKIHQCLQWLLDPDGDPSTDDCPDIVNNSWGITDAVGQCETEFLPDIQLLQQLGIIVVCSAGNSGPGESTSLSPANYPELLSVGSVNSSKIVSTFSSRGPTPCGSEIFPSLSAPGVSVNTTDLTFGGVIPLSYTYTSGTSIAAPHIAGAAALLKQAFGRASALEIIEALKYTAEDLGESGPDYDYGYGFVDVAAAYEYLRDEVCVADINDSGSVDLVDLNLLTQKWLVPCILCPEDIVIDGIVDVFDLGELAAEYSMGGCR
ncbi:MAG: S8 family serine peptidase [Sedimentisphaeraceae bacterium JB056]